MQLGLGRGSAQTNLRFADDVLLAGRTLPQAERMLADVVAEAGKAGLSLHPEKNKENGKLAVATFAFSEICEAYEVLSTQELKDAYDKYGEELMKTGVPDKK